MRFVVDTNVPIVANGGATNASLQCRLNAIDFLEDMMSKGRLVLDADGEVQGEYAKHLRMGEPGVGNRFVQAFLTTQAGRIDRLALKKKGGQHTEFPKVAELRKFDLSDRKFAVLSIKSKAAVANATDTDWLDFKVALEKHGVKIHFLCGSDKRKWFA